MFASTRNAGFSAAGPEAPLVTVTSQISRPSHERPMLSSSTSSGRSSRQPCRSAVSSSYVTKRSNGTAGTGLHRRDFGDERPRVERLEAEPSSDLLARRPRALGEEVTQERAGALAPPPVL